MEVETSESYVASTVLSTFCGLVRCLDDVADNPREELVVEPICQHRISQADAVQPCVGENYRIQIPSIGDEVEVTGSYAYDSEHGWFEIHPATVTIPR
jgi:hypothetical protein